MYGVMQVVYYAVQAAVFFGVFAFAIENEINVSGLAIGFVGVGLAAIATAIIHWSIVGVSRLFRTLIPRRDRGV